MEMFIRKVSMYPSLYYGFFLEFIGVRKWYTRIDKFCVLGALPMQHNYQQIIEQENIKAILTMNEDHELAYGIHAEEWKRLGVDYKQTAVSDYTGVASLEQIRDSIAFINKHRSMNQNVYIHCKAGRYRSALVTACYLIHHYQMTPEEARDRLKSLRSIVILDKKRQMMAMNEYYDHLYKKF